MNVKTKNFVIFFFFLSYLIFVAEKNQIHTRGHSFYIWIEQWQHNVPVSGYQAQHSVLWSGQTKIQCARNHTFLKEM